MLRLEDFRSIVPDKTLAEINTRARKLYGKHIQSESYTCGPTSAVNSFAYLENIGVYKKGSLIPNGDMKAVETKLQSSDYMATDESGTWEDMMIWGKYKYVEEMVPNVTKYSAQLLAAWAKHDPPLPPEPKPFQWVYDNNAPKWEFLYGELNILK